jgi:hypothetical protein
MNVVQFLEDKSLLGPMFRKKTFGPWKTMSRLLFSLPMTQDEMIFTCKHTGRKALPTEPVDELWLDVGRRGGKSHWIAAVAVFLACFFNFESLLAAGEQGVVLLVAADKRQSKILFDYIRGYLRSCPMLQRMVIRETADAIELCNHISIEVRAGSYRTVRGVTCVAALIDEAAFVGGDDSVGSLEELLAAIRPSMATIPTAKLIISSTPYSQTGPFHRASQTFFGNDTSSVIFWNADSLTMNPSLAKKVIDAAFRTDPVAALSEYGRDGFVQFRSDVGAFLPREVVEAATVKGRYELGHKAGRVYHAFCDPSGGRADAMTLGIAHSENDRAVLDVLKEIPAPFSPEAAVKEFAGVLKSYGLSEVTGDKYAAEWCAEQFQKNGIQYRAAEKSRSEIYLEFLPSITSGQVELLDNARLFGQLCTLERRTARVRDIVDHPTGGHDDCANSCAGASVLALGVHGGVLGIIELLKTRTWNGFLNLFQGEPSPRQDLVGKAAILEIEKKICGLETCSPTSGQWDIKPGPCPACRSRCTVILAGVNHCNQCSVDFDGDGQITGRPVSQCCANPILKPVSGMMRCQNCAAQVFPGGPPQTTGASRGDFLAGRLLGRPKWTTTQVLLN